MGGNVKRELQAGRLRNGASTKEQEAIGSAFDVSNISNYRKTAQERQDTSKRNSNKQTYGAVEEANKLFDNFDLASQDLNTASIDNLDFGDFNLAALDTSTGRKTQENFLEQMRIIFENRKKSILDRTLRPGQAATRGEML